MKQHGRCPKCGSNQVVYVPGSTKYHIVTAGFRTVKIDRYVCCACGYSEDWLDPEKLDIVKDYYGEPPSKGSADGTDQ